MRCELPKTFAARESKLSSRNFLPSESSAVNRLCQMLNAFAFLSVLLLIIEKTVSQEHGNAAPTQVYLAPTRDSSKEDEYYEDDASYSFRYNVEDPFAGNYYGHYEERDGDHTAGGYNVLLPDGRHQKVSYTVSGDSGFVARVEYEGVANFYSQPVRHDVIASQGPVAHSQSFSPSPGDPIHTELLPTPQAHTFRTSNIGAQQTHKAGAFAGTAGLDAGSVSNLNALGIQNAEITSSQHGVKDDSSEVGTDGGIINAGASSAPFEGIHAGSQIGSGTGTFALDAGSSHAASGGTEIPGNIATSSFGVGHVGTTGSPLAAGHITDGLSLGQTGSLDSSLSSGPPGSIPVGINTLVDHTETSSIPAGVQLNVDHSGSGVNLGLISQSPGVTVNPVRETGPVRLGVPTLQRPVAHSQSFNKSPGDPIQAEVLPTPQVHTFRTGNIGAQQTHKAGAFAGTAGFDAGSVSNLNSLGIQNAEITSSQHSVEDDSSEVGTDGGVINAGASSAPFEGIHAGSQTGSGTGTFTLDAGSSHAASGGTEFPGNIATSSFGAGHFGTTGSPLAAGHITDGLSLGQTGSLDSSLSFGSPGSIPVGGNTIVGHTETSSIPAGAQLNVDHSGSGGNLGLISQSSGVTVIPVRETGTVRHDVITSQGPVAHSQSFSTSPGDPIQTELLSTPQAHTFSIGNIGAQQTHKAGVFAGTAGFDAGSVSNLNALGIQNAEITSSQHGVKDDSSEVGTDGGIINAGASSAPFEGIHAGSQIGSSTGTFALGAGSSHAASGGTEFPENIATSSFGVGHFGTTGSPLAAGHITDGLSLGQTGSLDSALSFGSPGSIPVGGNAFVGHTETSIIPAGVQLNVDHSGSGVNLGLISQSPGVTVIPVRETDPVNNAFVASHDINSGTGFDVRSFEGFVPVLTENGGQGFIFSQALNEGSGFEVQQPGLSNQLTNVAGLSDFGIHAGGLPSIALTSGNAGFVEGTSNQFTAGGANILGTRHSDFNIVPIHSVGTDLVVTNELSNLAEGGNTGFVAGTSNQFTVGGANILGTRHSDFNIVPIHSLGTGLGVTNELSNVAEGGDSGFEIGQVHGITNILGNGGASFGVRPSSGIAVAEGTGIGQVGGVTGTSLSSSGVNFGVRPSDGFAVEKGIRNSGFGFDLVDGEGGSRGSDIRIGQVRGVTFVPLSSGGGVISETGASQETESNLGFRGSRGSFDSVGFSSNHIDELSSNQGKNLGVGHLVSNTGGKSNSFPSIDVNAFTVAPEPVKATDDLHIFQEDSPSQLEVIDTSRTALHTGTVATGHFNQVSDSDFQQPSQLELIDTSKAVLHTGKAAIGHINQVSNADFQQLRLKPKAELGVTVINFGSDLSHENLQLQSSHSSFNNNHIPQGVKAVKAPTIIAATLLGDDISGPHEAILRKLVDGALKGKVGSHPDIRVVRVA
ncbi:uncharacterized transmembrane protein DDB_G0289901-like [Macrobrachium rosenbergii]|uniref:uncharacterized transmembrane protein DDB_G0289901-like n=1 Tax=Macrobrachium rosenbergii TaxID=79674 RepID=UPI0034D6D746